MNKLIKYFLFLLLISNVSADQGALDKVTQKSKFGTKDTLKTSFTSSFIYAISKSTTSYTLVTKYAKTSNTILKQLVATSNFQDIVATNNSVYILEKSNTVLKIYNTDLNQTIASFNSSSFVNTFGISDDEKYLFLATKAGLNIIKISTMASIAVLLSDNNIKDLKVHGNYLYLANDWQGLKVIDISNPELATTVSAFSVGDTYTKLALEDKYLYTLGNFGLKIFDISSANAPIEKSTLSLADLNTSNSSLYVNDLNAYIVNNNSLKVYDTANKTQLSAINIIGSTISDVNNAFVENQKLYLSTTTGLILYSALSDFKNTFLDANTTTAKTKQELTDGVFGLLTAGDTDYIKMSLPSEKFSATVGGINDLNISIINNLGQIVYNISNNQKFTKINLALDSGTYYLAVNSFTNSTGEYSIKTVFSSDDWTDNKNNAFLISLDENIKGSITNFSDNDIFRIDTFSSGTLNISNTNPLIDFELIDALGNTFASSKTSDQVRHFNLPSAGTYFVKVFSPAQDIDNLAYTFRPSLSSVINTHKDNSSIALVDLNKSQITTSTYSNVKTYENSIYLIESGNLVQFDNNFTLTSKLTRTGDSVVDYTKVGDYIYVVTQSKFLILNTSLTIIGSYTTGFTNKKIKVNADSAYILTTSSSFEVMNISQKESPQLLKDIFIGNSANDFDIKTNFSVTPTNHFTISLYLATNNGLETWDLTDTSAITKLSTYTNKSYNLIQVTSPFIYAITNNTSFEILYAKKATSLPKQRSSTNLSYTIKKMLINQEYAYLIKNDTSLANNYLNILHIKDKTNPILLDTFLTRAEDIAIKESIAYILSDTKNLQSFDISNDYADDKQHAFALQTLKQIHGIISPIRATDVDLFYINFSKDVDLLIEANSTKPTNFALYNFISDVTDTNKTFLVPSVETNATMHITAGEYYLKVTANQADSAYNFKISTIEDDYANTFAEAQLISLNQKNDANISSTDLDIVKFTVFQRGNLIFTTDNNVTATLYYDDFTTKLSSSAGVTLLNPGTYYVLMDSNVSTSYTFNAKYTKVDTLSQQNGFDGITNFNATHVVYGDRYIYTIDKNNHFNVYNQLLQKVSDLQLPSNNPYDTYDFQHYCGKSFFYDNRIYMNKTILKNGTEECGNGFKSIAVDNLERDNIDSLNFLEVGTNQFITLEKNVLTNSTTGITIQDTTLINIDNNFVYTYSSDATTIYKISYKDLAFTAKAYGDFNISTTDIDNIKNIKNDGNIDLLAINNRLLIYNSIIDKKVFTDADNNVSTPDILTSLILESNLTKTFTLEGNITDMLIDRSSKLLYITNENSTNLKIINYVLGTKTDVNITVTPNGLFIHQNQLFITSKDYGLKVYNFPLTITSQAINSIPNVGKSISNPFTYTGDTFNYISNKQPSVYFLTKSFIDGTTTGTYTSIDNNSINDKTFEGCFIATAAYGSYLEKHVKVLRNFRDTYLLTNSLGKKFVHLYYTYSPSIASEIAKSETAKSIIRVALLPMIYMIKYPLVFLILFLMTLLTFLFFKFTPKGITHEQA